MHLVNCIGARFAQGIEALPNIQKVEGTILFFWSKRNPEHVCQFYGPNTGAINLKRLIGIPTHALAILQFLWVSGEEVSDVATDIPNVPMLCAPAPAAAPVDEQSAAPDLLGPSDMWHGTETAQ